MPGTYRVPGSSVASAAANNTVLGISAPGSAMRRFGLTSLEISFSTTADNNYVIRGRRSTAAGTSTAVTPQPDDPADAASNFTAGEDHSADPTYTAGSEFLELSLNQKNTFKWWAPPGSPIIVPATASNGIGFDPSVAPSTPTVQLVAHCVQY